VEGKKKRNDEGLLSTCSGGTSRCSRAGTQLHDRGHCIVLIIEQQNIFKIFLNNKTKMKG
jgi:hypothetical protein